MSDLVNREDVRMVQGRCGPRLLFEASQAFRLFREVRGQQLKRDLATERHVLSKIDLPHAAGAQQFDNAVMADSLACKYFGRSVDLLFRQRFSFHFERGTLDKTARLLMGRKQYFNLFAKRLITGAGFVEKRCAFTSRTRKGRIK